MKPTCKWSHSGTTCSFFWDYLTIFWEYLNFFRDMLNTKKVWLLTRDNELISPNGTTWTEGICYGDDKILRLTWMCGLHDVWDILRMGWLDKWDVKYAGNTCTWDDMLHGTPLGGTIKRSIYLFMFVWSTLVIPPKATLDCCVHFYDSYPIDVSHLSFKVLCLLLL
jgi:hypothetical protein